MPVKRLSQNMRQPFYLISFKKHINLSFHLNRYILMQNFIEKCKMGIA